MKPKRSECYCARLSAPRLRRKMPALLTCPPRACACARVRACACARVRVCCMAINVSLVWVQLVWRWCRSLTHLPASIQRANAPPPIAPVLSVRLLLIAAVLAVGPFDSVLALAGLVASEAEVGDKLVFA